MLQVLLAHWLWVAGISVFVVSFLFRKRLNRDNLGRFARSVFARKVGKYTLIAGVLWLLVHLFTSQYSIVHTRGIYGVVAKATYNAMIDDHAKAEAWDSMPPNYQVME